MQGIIQKDKINDFNENIVAKNALSGWELFAVVPIVVTDVENFSVSSTSAVGLQPMTYTKRIVYYFRKESKANK